MGAQGIPLLRITYLDFSCMLGIGVILAIYLAGTRSNNKTRLLLWLVAVFLLFVQFNQNARALLLATLISSVILIFLLHKKEIRTFLAITASLIVVAGVFAYHSSTLQERLLQAQRDIELSQQEKYNTSLGYRLAMWDVGLHGIAQRPLFGHGTGMAARYFDKTAETYKGGSTRICLNTFLPIITTMTGSRSGCRRERLASWLMPCSYGAGLKPCGRTG